MKRNLVKVWVRMVLHNCITDEKNLKNDTSNVHWHNIIFTSLKYNNHRTIQHSIPCCWRLVSGVENEILAKDDGLSPSIACRPSCLNPLSIYWQDTTFKSIDFCDIKHGTFITICLLPLTSILLLAVKHLQEYHASNRVQVFPMIH